MKTNILITTSNSLEGYRIVKQLDSCGELQSVHAAFWEIWRGCLWPSLVAKAPFITNDTLALSGL